MTWETTTSVNNRQSDNMDKRGVDDGRGMDGWWQGRYTR